jgi:hypothetical protein
MKNAFLFSLLYLISYSVFSQAPIAYNWQNSKQGWIGAGGCTLTTFPESMAMVATNTTPTIRSGNLQANIELNTSDYNQVQVSLKNPTVASGMSRLYIYPPNTNDWSCYYEFSVDTEMTNFNTYTIDLNSSPSSGTYSGTIARFGFRAPWGVEAGDTIFWENMTVNSISNEPMGNLYEDQFNDYTITNWGNTTISAAPKFNFFETACQELKISSDSTTSAPQYGYITYEFDSLIDVNGFEKITLAERSSDLFPIRIDLEDSSGNVTNGDNGKITVSTNSNLSSSSLMTFNYPEAAFAENNVDKSAINKLRVFLDIGTDDIPSPVFFDYLCVGDSTGTNNAIGYSEIDSCSCDVFSYDTVAICDSLITNNGNYLTSDGIYYDTISLFPACDSIRSLNLSILNSSFSNISISSCESYIWNGQSYNQSGDYFYTTNNILGCDSVVALDLTITNPSIGTDVQTACDSLVWIDGNSYTESNNTAMYTLTNALGCDSVVTLDLTITNPSIQLYFDAINSQTLTIVVSQGTAPYTYLWNTGDTSVSISPSSGGLYYVDVLDFNDCMVSDSIIIDLVTIAELNFSNYQVYPNPSSTNIFIHSNDGSKKKELISFFNLSGQKVMSEMVLFDGNSSDPVDVSSLSRGVYFIDFNTNQFSKQKLLFIKI